MESSEHRRAVYRQWMLIQEIVGDAKRWPRLTRRLFWKQNVKHFERLLLSAFVYVNGLNPDIFLEWAYLVHMCRDESGYRHFRDLFRLFDDRHYNLYAFHVGNNRYEYIDGTVRHYLHASRR